MKICRQKIYQTFFLRSFLKSFSSKYVEISKSKLSTFFKIRFGCEPIFIGRARAGLNLAVSYAIYSNKNKICLMSPLTIIDLVNMVENTGAVCEFYDFKKNSFDIDYNALKLRIMAGGVSSLIITHYYFVDDKIDSIVELCKKYNVTLIEDCAISLGATYKNKNVGMFGDISIFSFSLFKFLNFFWGGAIIARNSKAFAFIESRASNFNNLSIFDYYPQFIKFVKYGLVTIEWIYFYIFYIFRYGLKNNISFIKNNIQNDPFVPRFHNIEPTCFTKPNKIFYIELADKLSYVFSELEERRLKSFYIYFHINKKYCLPMDNDVFINGSFINFPIIFESQEARDKVALLLLDSGIDVSKQLYRNVQEVNEYQTIKGNTLNITNTTNRLLFLPVHRSVSFKNLVNMTNILNKILC